MHIYLQTMKCISAGRILIEGTGETLHMSQQKKLPLWIQSPEETPRSLNSWFEILCACALLYRAKTHTHTVYVCPYYT